MTMTKLLSKFRLEADETTGLVFNKGDLFMCSYQGINVRMFKRSMRST